MRLLLAFLLACMALPMVASNTMGQTAARLPNPVLYLASTEYFSQGGKDYTRYRYQVDNFAAYPDAMFASSPSLPPCGANTRASRTWVDFFDQSGKRLYGFCALGKASDLNSIWFAMEQSEVPPSWVYIELNDRQASIKYKSNLADTTQ